MHFPNSDSSELLFKRKLLEKARRQLKKEFIGINEAIDQVVDLSSSWFLFPNIQDRPVIITLFGLTGTGKTSLVKRFVDLIGYQQKHFHYEMNSTTRISFEDIEEIVSQEGDSSFILDLDEFQHLPKNRNQPDGIWELLDSGRLKCNTYSMSLLRLFRQTMKLQDALLSGVRVCRGVCVEGNIIYAKIVHDEYDEIDESEEGYYFLPPADYQLLIDICPEQFKYDFR